MHAHWKMGTSYAGFAAALVRQSPRIIAGIKAKFQQAMQAMPDAYQKRCGWHAFAADGSRVEAPLTRANEDGLGCAGRKKSGPQVFVTTLWHMGLGLPWDFRVGPGTDSERRFGGQHVADSSATWHQRSRTGTSVAARKPRETIRARSEKSRLALPKSNRPRRRKSNWQHDFKRKFASPPKRRCMAPVLFHQPVRGDGKSALFPCSWGTALALQAAVGYLSASSY